MDPAVSNDLDDTEDDVLCAERRNLLSDFSASYTQVRFLGGELVLETDVSYTRVRLIHEYIRYIYLYICGREF